MSEWTLGAFAAVFLMLAHGVSSIERTLRDDIGVVAFAVMALLSAGIVWRYWLSYDRPEYVTQRRSLLAVHAIWLAGLPLVASFGLPGINTSRGWISAILIWSELLFWVRTIASLLWLIRKVAGSRKNPAFVFAASFAILILSGTVGLMLPVSRAQPPGATREVSAPPLVALFTATSASCVTGLIVVDTPTYWSRTGQNIILALIQFGGLSVMTFGAFFALGQRRGFLVRESVFMGKLLEADDIHAVRGLMRSILIFTLVSELIGAALLMTLAPPGPWQERAYFGLFHSISSFCNAGFALLPKNLEGLGTAWQVWGVVAPLIILGGLGFDVLRNTVGVIARSLWSRLSWLNGKSEWRPVRLTLTARLVLVTTACLLAAGAAAFFILEANHQLADRPLPERIAHSWFQSITFRTAGFSTVDFTRLRPSTRLMAIVLMFIGASPGSTGGGIKTVVFAVMVLSAAMTIQGRERVELAGRTIPDNYIKRAGTVIGVAISILLTSTLLVVMFEQRPELFLDHLFETTSALGTVGLSTVNTATLKPASQLVLAATMFIGRVGPLTLLVAVARQRPEPAYRYPSERVTLG